MRFHAAVLCVIAATAAQAGPSAFPVGRSYIIQLGSAQADSGLAEYLVPPFLKAMDATGLIYRAGLDAEFAATIKTSSDVGKWFRAGGSRRWLYTRQVLVGLSPEDHAPRSGELTSEPAFGVTVRLVTENEDRIDELDCLVDLAVKTLAARYRRTGRVAVDGQSCKK